MNDLRLEVKQLDESGTFVALAAVYGTQDRMGDIIKKGAFTKTVAENPEVPIVWMHDVWQPLGKGQLFDTEAGLEVHGRLALKVTRAQEIYELMKIGVVNAFSIGYEAIRWSWDGDVRILEELRVDEVSPVTAGFAANQQAQLISVKSSSSDELTPEQEERIGRLLDEMLAEVRSFRRAIRDSCRR